MKTIEEVLRDRIMFIGGDRHTYYGTPAELIKELEAVKIAYAEQIKKSCAALVPEQEWEIAEDILNLTLP